MTLKIVTIRASQEDHFSIDVSSGNGFISLAYTDEEEGVIFPFDAADEVIEAIKKIRDENAGC